MIDHFIEDLISFFVLIDPIGTIPVFITVTIGIAKKESKKIAIKAIIYTAIILIVFILPGEVILKNMEIPLPAFQIAGV